MKFKSAMKKAVEEALEKKGKLKGKDRKVAGQLIDRMESVEGKGDGILWRALEAAVRRRYKRKTGKEIGDWADIIDWLIEYLPTILKLIALLFMFI